MTPQEREEFFAAVKGKRIRWTGWAIEASVTPKSMVTCFEGEFKYRYGGDERDLNVFGNGFAPNVYGDHWQFCDPADQAEYERSRAAKSDNGFSWGNAIARAQFEGVPTELECTCPCPIHGARGIEKAFSNGKGVAT